MFEKYESPFSGRYASDTMLRLFSQETRVRTWRMLWTALARAESELGLPITMEQVEELESHIDDIDYTYAAEQEKKLQHDVLAHLYAYARVAPSASAIIHLGATSCFVTDNADLIIYRNGLRYLRTEVLNVIGSLTDFAERYKSVPAPGYTHYQPAQPVTIGKRATLWLQDFVSDLCEIDYVLDTIKFLGCRGPTGTEASLLTLFDGNKDKVDELNRRLCKAFEFEQCFDVCGQTYPRKLDSHILNCLSSIGQSSYRLATDIRLLQHDGQMQESFEDTQIGSSAMPYKQNPIHCERICSLGRYLIVNASNASITASAQWLERSLDDSANRRISMPEGFLCADAVLCLVKKVVNGLQVKESVLHDAIIDYLPFIATENIIIEGVKRGGNRQILHEEVTRCCVESMHKCEGGEITDLPARLAKISELGMTELEVASFLKQSFVGNCVSQVDTYLAKIKPLINTQ